MMDMLILLFYNSDASIYSVRGFFGAARVEPHGSKGAQ